MKIYKVKVNGKVYEVEVEAVSETETKTISAAPQTKSTETVTDGANVITAPIAGKVLSINVNVGDNVSKGQTVAVIEAMKLENEIQSSYSGKVKKILVSVGSDVRNKDVLIELE